MSECAPVGRVASDSSKKKMGWKGTAKIQKRGQVWKAREEGEERHTGKWSNVDAVGAKVTPKSVTDSVGISETRGKG